MPIFDRGMKYTLNIKLGKPYKRQKRFPYRLEFICLVYSNNPSMGPSEPVFLASFLITQTIFVS